MTGLSSSTTASKDLRPIQILKSEKNVQSIENVIQNEYINPFGLMDDRDKEKLVNLSSGVPINGNNADEILQMFSSGNKLYDCFRNERLNSTEIPFHCAIKQNKYASFSKSLATTLIKSKDGKTKVIEVNRSILSALNSYSLKSGIAVDFQEALEYPLCPIPLSICNADSTRRFTAKSKLKDSLLTGVTNNEDFIHDVILVDTMALINLIIKIPSTYFELAKRFITLIPKSYKQVDIIADNYKDSTNSIKRGERMNRGESEQIQIASLSSKVPSDFRTRILHNCYNKARVIELIFGYIKQEKNQCFQVLKCEAIILSNEDECVKLTSRDKEDQLELQTTQEEADTKLILHAHHYLQSTNQCVTIYSPSGDTDVIVLAIALLKPFNERVYIMDGHGQHKRNFELSSIDVEDTLIQALIGFHALTGNDFVSSFFRKGKKRCFEILEKKAKYQNALALLGNTWELSDEIFNIIQQFVCQIYSSSKREVNAACYEMFYKKYQNHNKVVDMSTLPPCKAVLKLHVLRSLYIAALWKRSIVNKPVLPDMNEFGWNQDGTIMWVEEIYPLSIIDIFFNNDYDDSMVEEAEGESEDDEFL